MVARAPGKAILAYPLMLVVVDVALTVASCTSLRCPR
jgi:hypothetical protein